MKVNGTAIEESNVRAGAPHGNRNAAGPHAGRHRISKPVKVDGEWQVKWMTDGKRDEGKTYYTDDEQDAHDTHAMMTKQALGENARAASVKADSLTERVNALETGMKKRYAKPEDMTIAEAKSLEKAHQDAYDAHSEADGLHHQHGKSFTTQETGSAGEKAAIQSDHHLKQADGHSKDMFYYRGLAGRLSKGTNKGSTMNKPSLILARDAVVLARLEGNEVITARLGAAGFSLNDLQTSIRNAVAEIPELNTPPTQTDGVKNCSPCGGAWVTDVIAPEEEAGETWSAIVQGADGKLYAVQFVIGEDGKAETVGEPEEVERTTDYEYVGAMEAAAEAMVKAGAPYGNKNAAGSRGGKTTQQERDSLSQRADSSTTVADLSNGDKAKHEAAKNAHAEAAAAYEDHFNKTQSAHSRRMLKYHAATAAEHEAASWAQRDRPIPHGRGKDTTEGFVRCRDMGIPVLRAKKTWAPGEPVEFQWMPGGIHTITASYGRGEDNVPIELCVKCDEAGAARVQQSFDQIKANNPRRPPFICIEHQAKERAGEPIAFAWKDGDPEPGIYCTAEPSALGVHNVNGKIHTSFSPTFDTDADYSKLQCSECHKGKGKCKCDGSHVFTFAAGARGSRENPAEVTRLDAQSVGSLTNWNAFKEILPIAARQPDGNVAPQEEDQSELTEEEKIVAAVAARHAETVQVVLASEAAAEAAKPKPDTEEDLAACVDAVATKYTEEQALIAAMEPLPETPQDILQKFFMRADQEHSLTRQHVSTATSTNEQAVIA